MKQNLSADLLKFTAFVAIFFSSISVICAQIVSTVGGSYAASSGYGGNGTNALNFHILPSGLVCDNSGNIYFINGNAIRKLKISNSIVTTIAGSAIAGFGGDGGNATNALLSAPASLALDAANANLYISDQGNHRIRKIILSSNMITTVAGTGVAGFSGDGASAAAAQLNNPSGIVLDAAGNMLISDKGNQRIRKMTAATGFISTVAGTGTAGFSGDGAVAASAKINNPAGIAVDGAGNIYFADRTNNRVRKIAASNSFISTIAGNGNATYSGDGAAATTAGIKTPNNIVLDAASPTAIYISDANNRIRKITVSGGFISTYAGTGVRGFSGDGAAAAGAMLSFAASGGLANSIAKDAAGDLYVADGSNRIRKISQSNTFISSLAGTNSFFGDNGAATNAQIKDPASVAVDNAGNLYIADFANHRIRKVDKATGIISTFAGTGVGSYSGDSSLAINATLRNPACVVFDNNQNLIIADQGNSVIRIVDAATNKIYTIAGTGTAGYSGNNGSATAAQLYYPSSVAVDDNNNIYIADQLNYRIRRINAANGTITTIAGNGTSGYSGDNGAALSAKISTVSGLAFFNGNLYLADQTNNVIRMVDPSNTIYTFAGDGTSGYSGDGAVATSAQLTNPSGVAVDSLGNVYIADADNNVVRRVTSSTGFISTIAGIGTAGYAGDGGQALAAAFNYPYALAFATAKQLYVVDRRNNVMRLLTAAFAFPVKLTSFEAALPDNSTVQLKWNTSQETNSSRFIIQRSANGTEFQSIGSVNAAGNSNTLLSYNFTDKDVRSLCVGKVYYRLQQVDNDGRSEYSQVRSVTLKNAANSVLIYPNPASQTLHVEGTGIASLRLYDVSGKLVNAANGSVKEINVEGLNNGMYVLQIVGNDGSKETQKIIVKK